MKKQLLSIVTITLLATLVFGLFGNASASSLAVAPPSTGAYTSGVYRNLFKEAGYTDAQIQSKIDTAWNQLFYGAADQKVYYTVGADMAYMLDVADNDVRSEGQSYGMMIALQLNHKTEFDKLWKWAKTYMQHTSPSDPRYGYFSWHNDTSGNKLAQNNASDGEVWLVTDLFLADARWGSGSGIYNYKAEAQFILDQARSKEATSGTTGIYDLFNPGNSLVRLVPENTGETGSAAPMYQWTDPSYMEPAFYDYWAKVANKDNTFWSGAATAARNFLHNTVNASTGLMPNYANFDGTPHDCCTAGNHNTMYAWDARRTEMNVGMDYHWWAKDNVEITNTDKLQNFMAGQGVTTFGSEYCLNASCEPTNYHEAGHVGMVAAAGLAGTTGHVYEFVNHFYSVTIPTGTYRYYDGLLYFIGLLQSSGNFRIYGGGAAFSSAAAVQHSGQCMDVPASSTINGTQLQQWGCNSQNNQLFDFKPVTGKTNTYTIVNRNSGKCLDVTGISTANGAAIQQWGCSGGTNQQFTLLAVTGLGSNKDFQLKANHSNKCIDVAGISTAQGALLQQYDCQAGSTITTQKNQVWRLNGKP